MMLYAAVAIVATAGISLLARMIKHRRVSDEALWKKTESDLYKGLLSAVAPVEYLDDDALWARMGKTRGVLRIFRAMGAISTFSANTVRATDRGQGGSAHGQTLFLCSLAGRALCIGTLLEAFVLPALPGLPRICARMLAWLFCFMHTTIEALQQVAEYVY